MVDDTLAMGLRWWAGAAGRVTSTLLTGAGGRTAGLLTVLSALALFFLSALLITACGDGDSEPPTPVTPAPTPAPPPAPEPMPSRVPANLRVSESDEDFIEWTWDRVEGASGYRVQFSLDDDFTDADEIIARGRRAERVSAAGSSAYGGAPACAICVRRPRGRGVQRVVRGGARPGVDYACCPQCGQGGARCVVRGDERSDLELRGELALRCAPERLVWRRDGWPRTHHPPGTQP